MHRREVRNGHAVALAATPTWSRAAACRALYLDAPAAEACGAALLQPCAGACGAPAAVVAATPPPVCIVPPCTGQLDLRPRTSGDAGRRARRQRYHSAHA